jgi:aromatic ring-cleaving dioxygenase
MNPFTRFLRQWTKDRLLAEFIAYWDRLEKLVVLVHREKMTLAVAESEFAQVWPWLRQNYGGWAEVLRPYWQQTKAADELTQTDPFQLLLDIESPSAILDNWHAMQHLPAAREALNLYVRDQND